MRPLRISTLQYFIRPVRNFEEFEGQVGSLVRTAADYDCRIVVFPEYFSVQLLTLGDITRPIYEQVRTLAKQKDRIVEMLSRLAKENNIYIAGGTIPSFGTENDRDVYNECTFFSPSGDFAVQGKIHMTRWEKEDWFVKSRKRLRVIETDFCKLAITICYDVEFPELARAAAKRGAHLLLVPSCTDDRQGFLRVRYCAQARAIENQMYVAHACTVGSLPNVPAVSLNYGSASILTPSDFPFARDGILAEGSPNQETMVIAELDIDTLLRSRSQGTVLPLMDSDSSYFVASRLEAVRLTGAPEARYETILMTREHFKGVIKLCERVYPDVAPWTEAHLESHISNFPEGQIVTLEKETGRVVGYAASLVINWDNYSFEDSWSKITAAGMFETHDIKGKTLYGAEIMVDPFHQGRGVGSLIYRKREEITKGLGLLRIRAGARLRGYHEFSDEMSPEEYLTRVVDGEFKDPTLSFQLKNGFQVVGIAKEYLRNDAETLGAAAVIEWLNPEVATAKDVESQKKSPYWRANLTPV